MRTITDIYVNGAWTPANGGESIDVVNPATEEVLTEVHTWLKAQGVAE